MYASESQERLQSESNLGRCLKKFILDKNLIVVRNHHDSLCEQDATDLVSNDWHWRRVKVNDVLMSTRLVGVTIAMNTKVKLLTSKNKTFIQRRKQHILSASQLLNRDSEQSVITSCVASHD
jgi:hypothetical protein